LNADEPIFGLVAERDGQLVGFVHYLFHRSSTRIGYICYLEDLFTLPTERGRGVGRALIQAVYERAREAGLKRVYWQTHENNKAGRILYDKVASNDGFIVYETDV